MAIENSLIEGIRDAENRARNIVSDAEHRSAERLKKIKGEYTVKIEDLNREYPSKELIVIEKAGTAAAAEYEKKKIHIDEQVSLIQSESEKKIGEVVDFIISKILE